MVRDNSEYILILELVDHELTKVEEKLKVKSLSARRVEWNQGSSEETKKKTCLQQRRCRRMVVYHMRRALRGL